MIDLYDFTQRALEKLLAAWGFRAAHAAMLWRRLYRDGADSLNDLNGLPVELQSQLLCKSRLGLLAAERESSSHDGLDGLARKYLLRLHDGQYIETVLMRYRDRGTACLSSQVGCALGCVFCATGQQGFGRNLTAGEIVAQAIYVDRVLRRAVEPTAEALARRGSQRGRQDRLRNVVLMGMGEPLLNYDCVMTALEILHDPAGLAIGAKQITLSTVGVVPGIIRLADEQKPFSLAVSLHAASQAERLEMIPAARTWPLDALMEACRYYTSKVRRKIFFEWTLIARTNDSPEQGRALADLLHGIPAHVNLIPLNPTAGYAAAPSRAESIARFQSILRDYRIPSTVRRRRGIEIAAGCGQLTGSDEGKRFGIAS